MNQKRLITIGVLGFFIGLLIWISWPGGKRSSSSTPTQAEVQSKSVIDLLLSPEIQAKIEEYQIQSGDTLTQIAKRYSTTVELLKQTNKLDRDVIHVGKKLKVVLGKFDVLVDKSQNVLSLRLDEKVIKSYLVSTGEKNSTPIGKFALVNKLESPTWYKAGVVVPPGSPENILGTRWLGLSISGYGIHGTVEPEKIGAQVTAGCIRMRNQDVEELYALLPIGTPVTIED